MQKLVKNDKGSESEWRLEKIEKLEAISLSDFLAAPESEFKDKESYIRLEGCADLCGLEQRIEQITKMIIDFPAFTDGRGFSTARKLRDYYDYRGQLCAAGDYMQDQMYFLSRCGFDAFIIQDDANIKSIQQSLQDFSEYYQAAADDPQPLFRRRV